MKHLLRCVWILTFLGFFVTVGNTADDPLNPEERAWLRAHDGRIILGAEPGWPPVTFFDENGDFSGIGIEYLRLIEHRLGFRFKIEKMIHLQEILDKARRDQVDVIMNVMSTPERTRFLNFTKPYLKIPTVILTRRNYSGSAVLGDMVGKEVAVPTGFAVIEFLKANYPQLQLVYVLDSADGLRRLSTGEFDAMVAGLPAASYITEKEGLTNLRVAGFTGHEYNMGIGSRKNLPLLNQILDKGLAMISPAERDVIYRKWVHLGYQPFYKNQPFIIGIIASLATIVLLFSAILIWSRTLKRQVHTRTQELENELNLRHQAETALRESENILRGTLNSTADGILVVGSQDEILTTNQRFAEMWNIPQEMIINGTDQALITYILDQLEDPGAFRPRIEEIYKTAEESHEEIRLKDGRVFERYSCPLIRDGKEVGRVWNFRDISARIRAEAHLIQTQKMEAIGTLAGGIAHDFNNILSIILGYSELIKEGLLPEDPVAEKINAIIKAGERAKDLVGQILTFSRKSDKEFKPIQPHFMIKEALKMLRATIPTTIEIRQDVPDCGFIMGDPTQLHQIVMNLCTNAYYAMREKGGVLEVLLAAEELGEQDLGFFSMTSPPGSYVKLEINDTGHGIEKELQKTIFVPYFTTKKKGEGTGLGLSVVHGIVQSFGGHISVYSEPEVGTTFRIYLPKIGSEAEHLLETPIEPMPRGKEHILIVDDEVAIVKMEKEMLESLGYRVTAFTSSPEALRKFQESPDSFSLVITDVTMPDMTGIELMERLRAIKQETSIIFCTGFSAMINHEKAKHLGIGKYLMKPVLKRDLAVAVREILDEGKGYNPLGPTS